MIITIVGVGVGVIVVGVGVIVVIVIVGGGDALQELIHHHVFLSFHSIVRAERERSVSEVLVSSGPLHTVPTCTKCDKCLYMFLSSK